MQRKKVPLSINQGQAQGGPMVLLQAQGGPMVLLFQEKPKIWDLCQLFNHWQLIQNLTTYHQVGLTWAHVQQPLP